MLWSQSDEWYLATECIQSKIQEVPGVFWSIESVIEKSTCSKSDPEEDERKRRREDISQDIVQYVHVEPSAARKPLSQAILNFLPRLNGRSGRTKR